MRENARENHKIKKIVIIGAGPSGLGAARHSAELLRGDPDSELTIIERSPDIGGIWGRGQRRGPVYRDLHTNLPKELMAFPDFPFPDSEESFIHQSVVKDYLERYAIHFDLNKYVSLNTEVEEVRPLAPGDPGSGWSVKVKSLVTGEGRSITADLIFLTGIREQEPRLPDISNNFTGYQCHSSGYWAADEEVFRDKVVMVVGGGLSAVDIASDIAKTAAKVLISASRGVLPSRGLFSGNVEKVEAIKSIEGVTVTFMSDDEAQVDSVVWCTGYNKNPSYLHKDCGIEVLHDGYVLDPLYLHMININQPTMAILHIISGNVPFPQIDQEARSFLSLHRTQQMPSQVTMEAWLREDTAWRASLGQEPRHRHKMSGGRLMHWPRHMESLATAGSTESLAPVLGRMLVYTMALILTLGLPLARTVRFRVNETKTSFSVTPSLWTVNAAYCILSALMSVGILK